MTHPGLSRHFQAIWNLTRLARESYHWWWVMDFWAWPRDEFIGRVQSHQGQRNQDSRSPKSNSYSAHFSMWGESYRVLATGLDNQSVCLQIDPAAFASFSAWEEVRVVAGQHTISEHLEQFLAEKNTDILEQPSYTLGKVLCNFLLFLKPKEVIKGTSFLDMEAIKWAMMTKLQRIPQESIQECMEKDAKVC